MIGLLYQRCAVTYIMEKNSVSNRIRRYVDVISAKLHPLNQGGMARQLMTGNHRYLSRRAKPLINRSLKERVQNTIDNMKHLKK